MIKIDRHIGGKLCVEYKGTAVSLIAMGAVTEALLAPIGRGKTRYDSHGHRCLVHKLTKGRYYVRYINSEDRVAALPGVKEWLAAEAGVPLSVCDEVRSILERIGSVGA